MSPSIELFEPIVSHNKTEKKRLPPAIEIQPHSTRSEQTRENAKTPSRHHRSALLWSQRSKSRRPELRSMHGKARERSRKAEREGLEPGFAKERKPVLSRAYQNRVAAEFEGNRGSASTNSYFFLRYLIWRPPCAMLPLPLLRDMVQTGFDSSECIDARAWESKYCQNKNLLFTGVTELTNESLL